MTEKLKKQKTMRTCDEYRLRIHEIASYLKEQATKKAKGNLFHAKIALGEALVLLETERREKDATSEPSQSAKTGKDDKEA